VPLLVADLGPEACRKMNVCNTSWIFSTRIGSYSKNSLTLLRIDHLPQRCVRARLFDCVSRDEQFSGVEWSVPFLNDPSSSFGYWRSRP
jgi:hypothetical protein